MKPKFASDRCPKCKAQDTQCIDAGLVDESEYRETHECHACGKCWENIFSFTMYRFVEATEH